jgi:hypothetical protein
MTVYKMQIKQGVKQIKKKELIDKTWDNYGDAEY